MEIGYVILGIIIFTFVGYGIYATNKYLKEQKKYVRLNEAIEIVKQGGVPDDLCEWKHKHPFGDFPSCKNVNSISRDRNWKYCPYCGKKIKIVGD